MEQSPELVDKMMQLLHKLVTAPEPLGPQSAAPAATELSACDFWAFGRPTSCAWGFPGGRFDTAALEQAMERTLADLPVLAGRWAGAGVAAAAVQPAGPCAWKPGHSITSTHSIAPSPHTATQTAAEAWTFVPGSAAPVQLAHCAHQRGRSPHGGGDLQHDGCRCHGPGRLDVVGAAQR